MATAEKKTITKSVQTAVIEEVVQLTLSLEEAEFLAKVLHHVGGSPEKSPRKHQWPISNALARAGIKLNRHWYTVGEIQFEDLLSK